MAALPAIFGLAVITTAPSTPAPGSVSAPQPPQIRDIAPPLDVFPYPLWMVCLAGALALLLIGLGVWAFVRSRRRQPPPLPPSPAQIALQALHSLRTRAASMEPYPFSIEVSEVLRTYISRARFHVPATRLTTAEFLEAAAASPQFDEKDRTLLGEFLEKCDMIKFARVDATGADNERLVESGLNFVQGGKA